MSERRPPTDPGQNRDPEQAWLRDVYRPHEPQLTARAVISGCSSVPSRRSASRSRERGSGTPFGDSRPWMAPGPRRSSPSSRPASMLLERSNVPWTERPSTPLSDCLQGPSVAKSAMPASAPATKANPKLGDKRGRNRFVRAVAFSQTARPTPTGQETVYELFRRILDNFNLPLGSAEGEGEAKTKDMRSSTIWTTVWDTKNEALYYHTQHNRRVRKVDMSKSISLRCASRF